MSIAAKCTCGHSVSGVCTGSTTPQCKNVFKPISNNRLPVETKARIRADAEVYAKSQDWNDRSQHPVQAAFYNHISNISYIAGATAEASNTDRAVEDAMHKERNAMQAKITGLEVGYIKQIKLLSDALEKISNPMPELYDNAPYMRLVAKETLQQWEEGKDIKQWQPIETAPKDGTTIEITYDREGTQTCLARWSDNPICMLGSRCGSFPPGWATPYESGTDSNLPLDPPLMWREWKDGKEVGDE